jgi:hypothetical protein
MRPPGRHLTALAPCPATWRSCHRTATLRGRVVLALAGRAICVVLHHEHLFDRKTCASWRLDQERIVCLFCLPQHVPSPMQG